MVAHLLRAALLGFLAPTARTTETVELEVKDAQDLAFASGAEFRTQPLAKSGGKGAIIRSGGPQGLSSATVVKPSSVAITRVQLELEYLIGYESHGPNPPVLTLWVQDTPDATASGGKQVYESPPLLCDKEENHHTHCYTTCDEEDQRDCYTPGISVDAVCTECTGKYVSFRFVNNDNNLQVLLPITININEETRLVSYLIDFGAIFFMAYMLIGATVSAYHGKRGWHIIPHANHVRSIGGLVQDGILFSAASVRRSPASDPRQPLLAAEATTLQSAPSDGRTAQSTAKEQSVEAVEATPIRETAAEAKTLALREQRDQSVHSSQQPTKVIGDTTSRSPPTVELHPLGDDDNSRQLKATLGKQGTTAAQITLSQLSEHETRQTKGQLQKLRLSTEGSATELKDRLKQAQSVATSGSCD